MANEKMKPVAEYKQGTVKAAVFEREMADKSGKAFISKSVSLQISYRNQDGEWINNNIHIIKSNLKQVISVLNQAGAFIGTTPKKG